MPSPKKLHRSWAMYDWANSAYNLVITSTIFPAYYHAVTTSAHAPAGQQDRVSFFGYSFISSALFDYALAAAYLLIALISPVLSSIADYKGNKKAFMQLFCYLGGLACCALFFFERPPGSAANVEFGLIAFALAAVGYCGSLVFYNAFLPEIARPGERDRLSARGYAYGYVGSVLLQLICLLFVLKPAWFGITDASLPARLSFLLVGLWWIGFAQISFRSLPNHTPTESRPGHNLLVNGFMELSKVWRQLRHMAVMKIYLLAFFLYSMGVQTVMLAATLFGLKEIRSMREVNGVLQAVPLETADLIMAILLIQLVAVAGAWMMARLSGRFGNLQVLLGVVLIWIGICMAAYNTYWAGEFYLLASAVGLVMGGIQSLSRSTWSKLMPPTRDTASFFSFYDVTEKLAIVLGMFSFGFIEEATGSMRHSILALMSFFGAGAFVLYLAIRKSRKLAAEAITT
jgi:UMF1 family MFS transporter